MVERPQRSEDERPLHMWAPPRPHWAARKATPRSPPTCAADLTGQAWPGPAAAPLAAKKPHRPPRCAGSAARTSVTGTGNSASARLPGRATGACAPPRAEPGPVPGRTPHTTARRPGGPPPPGRRAPAPPAARPRRPPARPGSWPGTPPGPCRRRRSRRSAPAAAPRSAAHPLPGSGAESGGAVPGPPGHTHRPRTAAPGCRSPAPRRATHPPPPTPRPPRTPGSPAAHRRRCSAATAACRAACR